MNFRIEYLADHVDAIPALARWHHAEWTAITPHLTVSDRVARLDARDGRGGVRRAGPDRREAPLGRGP